jgi:pilus assembly protein CpaE
MKQTVCVHQLPEVTPSTLLGFEIGVQTDSEEQLLRAVARLDLAAVVLNLDEEQALETISKVRELNPHLAVIGATSRSELSLAIRAQRAGCSQITVRPVDPDDLLAALHQALKTPDELRRGQTFAVFSAMGGAGATTVACYFADALARITAKPTALFDLDLEFGSVHRIFDILTEVTLAHVAAATAVDESVLEKAAVRLESGVRVFVRPPTLEEAGSVERNSLANVLKASKYVYPYTVLDLPRRLDQITHCAIEECDKLLLVTQLSLPAVENCKRLIDGLQREDFPPERVAVLVNRHSRNGHSVTVDLVERYLSQPVQCVVPNDYRSICDAIENGKPLADGSRVRAALAQFAQTLIGCGNPPTPKSWLSRFGFSS